MWIISRAFTQLSSDEVREKPLISVLREGINFHLPMFKAMFRQVLYQREHRISEAFVLDKTR